MEHSVNHLPASPYTHLNHAKDVHLSRLSADISYEDKQFLHRVFPAKGVFNRITQLFFHSLVLELKQNGITTYTPANADEFGRIVVRRCTALAPDRKESE